MCICCCLLEAVLLAGCTGKNSKDVYDPEGGNLEDKPEEEYQKERNTSTTQWTVLGNTGVAEAWENVGSNASRQWILQCPDYWSPDKLGKFGQGSPGEIKWRGDSVNGVSALVYQGTKSELQQFLEQHNGALFAEEVVAVNASALRGAERRLEEQTFSNDLRWGLDRIDDAQGLDRSYNNFGITGANTHVYVLDTGIRTTHTEFEGRAIPEIDLTVFPAQRCNGDQTCASDVNGHGTHCAGTIAGKTVGVAKKATVHAVKVLGDDGSGSNAGIIRAINFVAIEGQRPAVISMSLGCSRPCQSRSEAIAIEAANRRGVTVVVAAGNNGRTAQPDACDYAPANIPQAITVASITINNDQRSSFSNIGNCVLFSSSK
jgi:subtilisin family serine protease